MNLSKLCGVHLHSVAHFCELCGSNLVLCTSVSHCLMANCLIGLTIHSYRLHCIDIYELTKTSNNIFVVVFKCPFTPLLNGSWSCHTIYCSYPYAFDISLLRPRIVKYRSLIEVAVTSAFPFTRTKKKKKKRPSKNCTHRTAPNRHCSKLKKASKSKPVTNKWIAWIRAWPRTL